MRQSTGFILRIVACVLSMACNRQVVASAAEESVRNNLAYLRGVMDEFHNRFPVYDDVSSPGNHFHAYAKIPHQNAPVEMNGSWADNPHSGATAIRCEFRPTPDYHFGGFYLQNGTLTKNETAPQPNFGTVPDAGIEELRDATVLTFWARGNRGGERIDFFMAGVGRHFLTGAKEMPFPDSSPRYPPFGEVTTLTATWQKYSIQILGLNLNYVLGGFAWNANDEDNPDGAVFFLDDIQYELSTAGRNRRLNQPRFLRSFTTLPLQPDPFDATKDGDIDFVLRNLAFTYDNALALLAFLAEGSADSVRRARLIGDAFVYASRHDRTFDDDRRCDEPVDPLSTHGARLRSAYAAGDLTLPPGWTPKGRIGTVPIPGFYAEATKTFYEVEQQAIDTGNNAWAVIALLALHRKTAEPSYLETACRIANFLHAFRRDVGEYRGFTGGVEFPDAAQPSLRPWASSEHNLDLYAAFTVLFQVVGDVRWQHDAEHARQFVEAMWDAERHCYLAGTTSPDARNTTAGTLPLDVQAWSGLSLPRIAVQANVLQCAERNHLNTHHGFTGFDFNDDKDGVWFEGTAQMAVAFAFAGEGQKAQLYREELRRAQRATDFGNGEGIAAACHDGLSTGFTTAGGDVFKYFRRLHVGATAWNVFAQSAFNPYYSVHVPPRRRAVRH